MPDEQKLFRAMQPIAKKLYDTRRTSGAALDARALTDETVKQFERAIVLGPHAPSVRERLERWVRQLIAGGGTPPAES